LKLRSRIRNVGEKKTGVPEVLLDRIEPAFSQRPLILAELVNELVRLEHFAVLLVKILVNLVYVEKVYREENVSSASFNQVRVVVLFLVTLLTLARDYWSTDTRY